MRLRRAARGALLACLAAAILAEGPASAAVKPATVTPGIEGPPWQLTEYRVGDGLSPVLPGLRAEAFFWAGTVSGFAGCADFSTPYKLVEADVKVTEPQVSSEDCDADTKTVQDAFLADLAQAHGWQVDGAELSLTGDGGDPLLRFTAAAVPAEVTIAPWTLARIADASGRLQPVVADTESTATFLPGGRVVGSNGCGGFLGTYATSDTDLTISDVASRVGECDPAVTAQATAIVDALERATQFEVTPAGLTLLDADGAQLLTWVPSPVLRGALWTPTALLAKDGTRALRPGRPRAHGGHVRGQHRLRTHGLPDLGGALSPVGPGPHVRHHQAGHRTVQGGQARQGLRDRPPRGRRLRPARRLHGAPRRRRRAGHAARPAGAPRGRGVAADGHRPGPRQLPGQAHAARRWHAPHGRLRAGDPILTGSTGCNDYAADYDTNGIAIDISGALPGGRSMPPARLAPGEALPPAPQPGQHVHRAARPAPDARWQPAAHDLRPGAVGGGGLATTEPWAVRQARPEPRPASASAFAAGQRLEIGVDRGQRPEGAAEVVVHGLHGRDAGMVEIVPARRRRTAAHELVAEAQEAPTISASSGPSSAAMADMMSWSTWATSVSRSKASCPPAASSTVRSSAASW